MRILVLAVLFAAATASAQADIYKCTDASGHVTYSNVLMQGCKKLSLDPVSTVPATRPAPAQTPATFPRVDDAAQKARDADRRRILDQEMASEQAALDAARKALADQEAQVLPTERNVGGSINAAKVEERLQSYRDKVALHERNIEALKKELGRR